MTALAHFGVHSVERCQRLRREKVKQAASGLRGSSGSVGPSPASNAWREHALCRSRTRE